MQYESLEQSIQRWSEFLYKRKPDYVDKNGKITSGGTIFNAALGEIVDDTISTNHERFMRYFGKRNTMWWERLAFCINMGFIRQEEITEAADYKAHEMGLRKARPDDIEACVQRYKQNGLQMETKTA